MIICFSEDLGSMDFLGGQRKPYLKFLILVAGKILNQNLCKTFWSALIKPRQNLYEIQRGI